MNLYFWVGLDGRSIKEIVFLWFFVCPGLHQRNDDFVPVTSSWLCLLFVTCLPSRLWHT
jgi:hypothetical protein